MKILNNTPVKGFPMRFIWQGGDWEKLFDEQIKLIREDISHAKSQGKMIIYLSCPISNRGGGYSGTNVEIAEYTKLRLQKEWGSGFWILNPASYQMESKGGTGLMYHHARTLWKDKGEAKLDKLKEESPAKDGDYRRMWTKILVEDNKQDEWKNCGFNFDGFYFLGPSDVISFFVKRKGTTLTSAITDYFSRKLTSDPDFKNSYAVQGIIWSDHSDNTHYLNPDEDPKKYWKKIRYNFLGFYSLKASVNFSLGGHDEWNIWVSLNHKRVAIFEKREANGNLIPAFFDGRQVTPSDFVTKTAPGYEL